MVTGVAAGDATITATNSSTSQTATVAIEVIEAVATGAAGSGDFDGDGVLGSGDALALLIALANGQTLTAEQIAAIDLDGDGRASATDAACILRADAGLELPAFCTIAGSDGGDDEDMAASGVAKGQEGGGSVVVSSASGAAGDSDVAVTISSPDALTQFLSLGGSLTYDALVLNAASATPAEGLQGTVNIDTPGVVTFALSSSGTDLEAGAAIVTINFTVAADASPGESALDLDVTDFATFASNAAPTSTDGSVTVAAPPTSIVIPDYRSADGWTAFVVLAGGTDSAPQTMTMTAYPDGGTPITCNPTGLQGAETNAQVISAICEGSADTDGWVRITSSPTPGGVTATIASFPASAAVLVDSTVTATGNHLVMPYVVGLDESYIIVNPNDADEEVTVQLHVTTRAEDDSVTLRTVETSTTIPANSRIVRSFSALFPDEDIAAAAFFANIHVGSTNPIAGANCIGSEAFGLMDCVPANARTPN